MNIQSKDDDESDDSEELLENHKTGQSINPTGPTNPNSPVEPTSQTDPTSQPQPNGQTDSADPTEPKKEKVVERFQGVIEENSSWEEPPTLEDVVTTLISFVVSIIPTLFN